jgi:hypothetical protein
MKNKCPIRLGVGPQIPQQKQPKSAFRFFAVQHFIGSSWIQSPGCTAFQKLLIQFEFPTTKLIFKLKDRFSTEVITG